MNSPDNQDSSQVGNGKGSGSFSGPAPGSEWVYRSGMGKSLAGPPPPTCFLSEEEGAQTYPGCTWGFLVVGPSIWRPAWPP